MMYDKQTVMNSRIKGGRRSLDEFDSFAGKLMDDFKMSLYLEEARSALKEPGYLN